MLLRRRAFGFLPLLVTLLAAPGEAAPPCSPWPGEPNPLPDVHSQDPMSADWAVLRSRELALLADLVENDDPLESHRLWQRVRCLDPESEVAHSGLERTRPVVVRRAAPVVLVASVAPEPPLPTSPAPPLRRPSPSSRAEVDRQLARLESRVSEARFAEALQISTRLREKLPSRDGARWLRERRVRLEVLTATAMLAFDDAAGAGDCFRRALQIEPELRLDGSDVSPKVRRALERSRWTLESASR